MILFSQLLENSLNCYKMTEHEDGIVNCKSDEELACVKRVKGPDRGKTKEKCFVILVIGLIGFYKQYDYPF